MRSETELWDMLEDAEHTKRHWYNLFMSRDMTQSQNAECLRNYTALRGVVKALRWVLEDIDENPLD
jgi:hypothetical protein